MNDLERWRKIPIHEQYEVSDHGNIRSKAIESRGCVILKKSRKSNGYQRISVYNVDGSQNYLYVHRLVAEAFIPNPNNYPFVLHRDNNPSNNHWDNLRWGTQSENIRQAIDDGLMNPKGRFKLTQQDATIIMEAIEHGFKQRSIAKYYNIHERTVCMIKKRKHWASV